MENNEIIRLQEDLKYWENAFLRLQEQHRVIQKLFYELRGKTEEGKIMKYDKGSFMWAAKEAINGIVTKRKSKSFLLKITRFGTPKFQRQEGRKNYVDLEFEDYFATDWEVVEEKKPNIEDAAKEEIHILLDVEHLKAIKSYAEHMESGIVGDIWGNAYRGLKLAVKMIKLFPKTSWEDIETPKITLSDKIYAEDYAEEVNIGRLFKFDDVKDFIKTIKHKIYIGSIVRGDITRENAIKIIDDEAGDKLK